VRSRDLHWEGVLNARDLGGHRTEDGRETRFGAIVRADSVHQLTEAGWAALADYGVRTVIDLRNDDERLEDPPPGADVELLHVPFMAGSKEELDRIFHEVEERAKAAPDVETATRDVYLTFLEHFGRNVAAAVQAVATAQEGAVVIHCAGGKDRTGLLTAFLLDLAGVEAQHIGADYALSEERLQPRHDAWLAEAETEAERERLRRITRTPAASIVGVLEELGRRHGGVEGYLLAGGATTDELERARARLLDEPRMAAA
jgi:protein tyrosine/serine phosphatase